MLQGAEKARIALSGDDEALLNIDFLQDDEDLVKMLTRDAFE